MSSVNSFELSTGSIQKLIRGDNSGYPILQILDWKQITCPNGVIRHRLCVSDGIHSYTRVMTSQKLNQLVPTLSKMSIVRLDEVLTNFVLEKAIIIIYGMTMVKPGNFAAKVGNPTPWNQELYHPNNRKILEDDVVVSISEVTPYNNRGLIRAHVTNKSTICYLSGIEESVFYVDLIDESGEIRINVSNSAKFYSLIDTGSIYYIKNYNVKQAKIGNNNLDHTYEISFRENTIVFPCLEPNIYKIPVQYKFTKISDIGTKVRNTLVDVIGICKRRGGLRQVLTKDKEVSKREIILVDESNREVTLTLWDKTAVDFQDDGNPIICVRGVRVSVYYGRSLSLLDTSSFKLDPDVPEASALRQWWTEAENRSVTPKGNK